MKKAVIINGAPTSGKDTLCDICKDYANCIVISTIDKVREAYMLLGWDGEKSPEHRKALSDIKDIGTANLDHPFTYIKQVVSDFNQSNDNEILFIHSREPEEIKRFVENFGCITLLVKNSNVKIAANNHADAEVENYNYDYTVDNSGTLIDLRFKAMKFVNWLRDKDVNNE